MPNVQRRVDAGRTRGRMIVTRLITDLVEARRSSGLSQEALASLVGWSQSDVSRFERLQRIETVTFIDIASVAAVLGKELGANLYLAGEPIRDRGHQALIDRFRALLSK